MNQVTSKKWSQLDWPKIETKVSKLQRKIYIASVNNDIRKVQMLQKILLSSAAAKKKAVRRVTQENKGKNTPGLDGLKSLNQSERLTLSLDITIDGKAEPLRRVYIPKPGSLSEKRPLGIPSIKDRAKQSLALMALEPEWEAKFEANSYGFRPGRSCHDALEAIFHAIAKKPKYVLDGDIRKCFDQINHEALVKKVSTFPLMQKQIKSWLKAGIVEEGNFFETTSGTPQGGVISPLLANIALHGLEEHLNSYVESRPKRESNGKVSSRRNKRRELLMVRYADDFLVIHPELDVILESKKLIEAWLKPMSLELHPDKTRIRHTLNTISHDGVETCAGFDFLGASTRQFRIGKFAIRKSLLKLPFRTLQYPSKEKVKQHQAQLNELMSTHLSTRALIAKLSPVISGWARYYSTMTSSRVFHSLNKWVFIHLMRWAKMKHPTRSTRWIMNRYFKSVHPRKWVFGESLPNGEKIWVPFHSASGIKRHVKVQGHRSPYDGDWVYWSRRLSNYRLVALPKRVVDLLRRQKGKCLFCKLYFFPTDRVEVDHIIPRSRGGKSRLNNLQLLHLHCHHSKTLSDRL